LMVPNTEAEAGKHASSASKLMIAIDRFDILIPRRNRSQVPVFSSPNNKSASLPEQKACKGVCNTAGTIGPAFGTSFEAETMRKQAEN
jgi:hypothetical protein